MEATGHVLVKVIAQLAKVTTTRHSSPGDKLVGCGRWEQLDYGAYNEISGPAAPLGLDRLMRWVGTETMNWSGETQCVPPFSAYCFERLMRIYSVLQIRSDTIRNWAKIFPYLLKYKSKEKQASFIWRGKKGNKEDRGKLVTRGGQVRSVGLPPSATTQYY